MELEEGTTFFFQPRALKNLVLVDEIDSLAPIMSCQIADLANEDTPQLYAACGRGPRSSLRVLRHGLEVGRSCLFCFVPKKGMRNDIFESYII
jgi:splicing factor 3B subunit 3